MYNDKPTEGMRAVLNDQGNRLIMNFLIVIVGAVLLLAVLTGMAAIRRKRKPKCACFELIGDNANCPIADHRDMARAHEQSWQDSISPESREH